MVRFISHTQSLRFISEGVYRLGKINQTVCEHDDLDSSARVCPGWVRFTNKRVYTMG